MDDYKQIIKCPHCDHVSFDPSNDDICYIDNISYGTQTYETCGECGKDFTITTVFAFKTTKSDDEDIE